MSWLCDRPGCSDESAVLFRFDAGVRQVWLELPDVAEEVSAATGALCARHADAMLVPRGWILHDRRENTPRLFRPPAPTPPSGEPRLREAVLARCPSEGSDSPTQLTFDDDAATVVEITDRETSRAPEQEPDADETAAMPWAPAYDPDDDLGGVLDAKSELLSRAFRGQDRPGAGHHG